MAMTLLVACSLAACGGGDDDAGESGCNGMPSLCDKRLDEVSFAKTHNSHANLEAGYHILTANQRFSVRRQLGDGVRSLNFDVYLFEGRMITCHTVCQVGQQNLLALLGVVRDFLEANPREVVLLDLQNEAPMARTLEALEASVISEMAHIQPQGEPWPTLAEMIESNKRIVLFAKGTKGTPEWMHENKDYIFATAWGTARPEQFSCKLVDKKFKYGLFELDHTLSDPISRPDLAELVNHDPYLSERAKQCAEQVGKRPNMIGVDWYSTGDLLTTIERLNHL